MPFAYLYSRLFLFPFSPAFCSTKFVRETLCKFLYFYASLKCMFMQSIMVNRKLFGNFEFSCTFAETFYLFTFYSFVFSLILDNLQETKKPIFAVFCRKTSLFVANNVLILRDLHLYRANHTPPPAFGTRRVGQLSSENFLFFYFLFFVKYYDFINSAFLPNFEHFPEYHIYFFFCIKFHSIYF